MNRPSLLAALVPATVLLAAPSPSADDAADLLADDLRFAEALAVSRFYDLADDVAGRTYQRIEGLSGDEVDLAGEASLIRARIDIRRSEATPDPEERLAAMTRAVEALRDWSRPGSDYAYLDRMTDALEDLAKTLSERGKEYADRYAEGDAAAQALADSDFREADEVFKALEDEARARAEQLEGEEKNDRAEEMAFRAATTFYLRGLNSVDWADVATDREFRLEQAIEHIDEFLWEVSEESLVYYSATYEMARALHKLGEVRDARELLENILELGTPIFWEYEGENIVALFPAGVQRIVAGLFDNVWGYLAVLDAEDGDLAGANQRIETMLAEHQEKGVPMGREGHTVLLDWARKLLELGRTSEASHLALKVSEEGRGSPVGGRAEVFLSSLVTSGDVRIDSPDALKSAADGFRTEQKHDEASYFYARAASLAETEADLDEFAYESWMGAGRSLRQLSRHLEAAVAFEEALDVAVNRHADDVTRQETAAQLMYQSYASRFTETQDTFDKALRDGASQRILELGLELDVQFQKAEETFYEVAKGDVAGFLAALAEFEAVPESSTNYERAIVFQARCLVEAGRNDDALARFQQLEDRVADARLEPTNDAARQKREIALAQSRYFQADLLLDLGRPTEALTLLEGYEAAVPTQDSYHVSVKYQRVLAHAMAGQVAEAEDAFDVLEGEPAAKASLVSSAAFRVASALQDASVEAADAGDDARARDLLHRAAEALERYCVADGYSSYRNILTTGEWYLDAADPEAAFKMFEKAEEVHGGKISQSDLDDAFVGQARALDAQHDFARSRPLWKDLVTRSPAVSIKRGAARSFGGWLELQDDGSVVEIPGSGDYEDAHDIWVDLYKGASQSAKYTALWWEAKLGTIDTWYRQRNANPEKGRQARQVLDQLRLLQPNYDKDTIEQKEAEGLGYSPLYAPKFKYLERRLPTG